MSPKTNNFSTDLTQETVIRRFVETECYPLFYKSIRFADDMSDQYSGIDYFLDGRRHDIKAQTKKYICAPTQTFCLEIACYNANQEWKKGWFIKNQQTEFYDWAWIHEADYGYQGNPGLPNNRFIYNPDDIHKIEIMSVDAAKMKKGLMQQFGISVEDLWVHACDMKKRYAYTTSQETISELFCGIKFVMSPWLSECPVNVVLKKEWYANFSSLHYTWTKGIVKLHNKTQKPKCPKCGNPLVQRKRRDTGDIFLGCIKFPECKYTKNI